MLDEACARVAGAAEGTRNDALNREAFVVGLKAADGSIDASEAEALLEDAARRAGLDEAEIVATMASAREGASKKGRSRTSNAANWEFTNDGGKKRSYKNALLAIRELGIEAKRDTFGDKILLSNCLGSTILPDDHVGPVADNVLSLIRKTILDRFGFDAGKEYIFDAIKALAEERRFDPVQLWLDRLEWDRKPRLRDWLPRISGAPSTPLNRWAGASIVVGMVVRARHPGTKFDLLRRAGG